WSRPSRRSREPPAAWAWKSFRHKRSPHRGHGWSPGVGALATARRRAVAKAGKKFTKAKEAVAVKPTYALPEAVQAVAKNAFAKFDETVEVAVRLGVDPKHADQMVRGTVILPHGLGGKAKKVLVIASGEKLKEGQDAGADFVGGEDMVNRIQTEN